MNRFSRGLFTWVGFDIREVPFDDAKRDGGGSRWSLSALVGYSIDGLLSFNDRPLRFMIHLGWVGIAVFFAYLIYVLITVAVFGVAAPGYVTLIAAIFFFGGLQLFSIGLVGEYLGRIYSETKARPLYVVRETERTSADADHDQGGWLAPWVRSSPVRTPFRRMPRGSVPGPRVLDDPGGAPVPEVTRFADPPSAALDGRTRVSSLAPSALEDDRAAAAPTPGDASAPGCRRTRSRGTRWRPGGRRPQRHAERPERHPDDHRDRPAVSSFSSCCTAG